MEVALTRDDAVTNADDGFGEKALTALTRSNIDKREHFMQCGIMSTDSVSFKLDDVLLVRILPLFGLVMCHHNVVGSVLRRVSSYHLVKFKVDLALLHSLLSHKVLLKFRRACNLLCN